MLKNSHALLTIENLPKMDKRTRTRLVKWLSNVSKEIETKDIKSFDSPCRFRLMK